MRTPSMVTIKTHLRQAEHSSTPFMKHAFIRAPPNQRPVIAQLHRLPTTEFAAVANSKRQLCAHEEIVSTGPWSGQVHRPCTTGITAGQRLQGLYIGCPSDLSWPRGAETPMPHTPIGRLDLLLVLKYPPMPKSPQLTGHTQQSSWEEAIQLQVIAMRAPQINGSSTTTRDPSCAMQQDYSGLSEPPCRDCLEYTMRWSRAMLVQTFWGFVAGKGESGSWNKEDGNAICDGCVTGGTVTDLNCSSCRKSLRPSTKTVIPTPISPSTYFLMGMFISAVADQTR